MIIKSAELETVCGITSKLPENDLPEFLRREDVCIDAAHASVEISMNGDIPMDIFLNGVFNSNQQR